MDSKAAVPECCVDTTACSDSSSNQKESQGSSLSAAASESEGGGRVKSLDLSDDQEGDDADIDDFDNGINDEGKKFGGYTYWKRTVPDEARVVAQRPARIADPIVETATTDSTSGPSQWNKAGTTWEERDVTNKVKGLLTEALSSGSAASSMASLPGLALHICAPHVAECDCSIYFVRGKARFGFDIQATVNWLFYSDEVLLLEGTVVARDWTDHSEATLDTRVSTKPSFGAEDLEDQSDGDDTFKDDDTTTANRRTIGNAADAVQNAQQTESLWREYHTRIERLLHNALNSSIQQVRDTLLVECRVQSGALEAPRPVPIAP